MPYTIKAWIPVEADKPEIYAVPADAISDLSEIRNMQPENIYEIIKCDEAGQEI